MSDRDDLAALIRQAITEDDVLDKASYGGYDSDCASYNWMAHAEAAADAILAAGWRAPLEREPDLPYPFGWSEDADTCKRRGHQLTHADRRRGVPCARCRRRKQEANCPHEKSTGRYAGILGMRYYCAACGGALASSSPD